MSSERKILKATRRKTEDYINSLPEEVLRIIFDRLNFKSVKNASETCKRWNSIIFLSGYVNRCVFKVELFRQIQIKQIKAIVANSQRCYRNLHWNIAGRLEENEFAPVWETIHPKVTEHLHSFVLSYVNCAAFLPLLADVLPVMSALRSLTLTDDKGIRDTQNVIPTLRSDVMKHLIIRSMAKYRLDMPQLQSFEGELCAFHLPDDSREAVALSSLKDLTVYRNFRYISQQRISILRSLFRQTRLETIRWSCTLENEIFSLIGETCTTLRELHLQHEYENEYEMNLNSLSNLTNLHTLGIKYGPIDFDSSKLNQLEELQLFNVAKVVKLPTSIRRLQVHVWTENELDMSHAILSCSTQLTELVVKIEEEDKWLKYDAPVVILKGLPQLKHLQVLKFYRGRFRKSSFLCMDAPLDALHQLHFEESNVSSKRFLGLQEKFPNLKKLSFLNCHSWKEIYERDSDSMSFTESDEDD